MLETSMQDDFCCRGTLTPASIVPITMPKSTPNPMPITPDMTVLTPQLFIMSSCTICSGVGICICLYTFLGLALLVDCSVGGAAIRCPFQCAVQSLNRASRADSGAPVVNRAHAAIWARLRLAWLADFNGECCT